MEDFPSFIEKEALISFFLENATSFSSDAAVKYLQATNWRLEDALELFFLFRPSSYLIYHGSFHDPKVEAHCGNRWLRVNLQNMEEFSSHVLNRDTWSNGTIVNMIQANFVFRQGNHDTDEGKKVCTYYNLISSPAIPVINPITGRKMRS
ncbi:plant UBX domain-containing protein 7-like [Phoenix dactylifera]|uniref:Plant UBX domain-containing protein 7-like n=1 Tax=Phoenix dactylifera TaxID=42345 RepID=A0A8B8ZNM5_PHODC|nr:plant UBX domain-containing protein 7-like [Phoenix dactylifera]